MPPNFTLEKVCSFHFFSAIVFSKYGVLSSSSESSCDYVDFDNADALLISEVKMLLEHRKAQHESQDDDQDLSEVGKTVSFQE